METGVYVDDHDAAADFYWPVFGLRVMGKEPGHHVFFQVGDSSGLLAFLPQATLKGDRLPSHGTKGPGHFALGIERKSLGAWRQHLEAQGVAIEKDVTRPAGCL